MPAIKKYLLTCEDCGFTTHDEPLIRNHSCAITEQGGMCEDYPCCGHEAGDCNGQKYGSDEAIKEAYYARAKYYDFDDPYYEDYN